ncbi:TetR/AcrR family transcriptional regulator [Nocardioides panzhihuensis]|uniref:AcrR family transcriptional regulator n=1 Tax=Nocardioides panzhihuensis TaxID=860243 RepID=A0A7Z0DJ69_9ACTN|nr:TetR/AcrR family transcriptional regulator [Nocardioides panzhihuensis]NYI76389.1 AcrR family transcriptional regulator [Nocardioides panzhihuensis]
MTETMPRYHHGDLRAAVLRRAEEVLRESGTDALSLRGIARDLGVSHAAPSAHFRDKNALFDALAVVGFRRLGEVTDAALATRGSLTDDLVAFASAYLGFATDNPALLSVMFARKHSETAGAEIAGAVAAAFAHPTALLTDGQVRGEVADGDPEVIGVTVLAALQGLATFVGSGFVTPEQSQGMVRDVVETLMRGLAR